MGSPQPPLSTVTKFRVGGSLLTAALTLIEFVISSFRDFFFWEFSGYAVDFHPVVSHSVVRRRRDRRLSFDCDSFHPSPLRPVVNGRVVLHRPVVPHDYRSRFPFDSELDFRPTGLLQQELKY